MKIDETLSDAVEKSEVELSHQENKRPWSRLAFLLVPLVALVILDTVLPTTASAMPPIMKILVVVIIMVSLSWVFGFIAFDRIFWEIKRVNRKLAENKALLVKILEKTKD